MATTGKAYNPPRETGILFNSVDYKDENDNIITTTEALQRYRFNATGSGETSSALLNDLATNEGIEFQKTVNDTTIASIGASRTDFNINSNTNVFIGGNQGSINNNIQFNLNSSIQNINTLTCANGFTGDLTGKSTSSNTAVNALDCDPNQPNITTLNNATNVRCMDLSVANKLTVPNLETNAVKWNGVDNTFDTTRKLQAPFVGNRIQGASSASQGNNIIFQGDSGICGINDSNLSGEAPQIAIEIISNNRPSFSISKGGSGNSANHYVSSALRHRYDYTSSFGDIPYANVGTHNLEFQEILDYVNDEPRFRLNAQGKWLSAVAGWLQVNINFIDIQPRYVNENGTTGRITYPENLKVYGTFSGGTKSFEIDHPLDNSKKLFHIAIEAPRVENMYQGVITLLDGYGEVNMDIFSKLSVGTWIIINHNACSFVSNTTSFKSVRSSIQDGILRVYCEDETSNDIISWIVIAERNDDEIKQAINTDENGRLITEFIPISPISPEEEEYMKKEREEYE